jgi:dinuclear metal center YbgI/SA1388 family protein
MKLYSIIERLEKFAPKCIAEDWDNVGLQVGDPNADIEKAVVCLDVNSDIIDFAIENKINLIVSHHPFMMSATKSIDLSQNPNIKKIIKNDISVYSMHTNFDFCFGGLNDILCEKLGLSDYLPQKENDLRIGKLSSSILLSEFISKVKEVFNVETILFCGDLSKKIQQVALCSGGGGGYLELTKNADVYLTGELKYHEFQRATQLGVAAVTAGHFETEDIALFKLREILKEMNLEVLETSFNRSFCTYI